MEKVIKFSPITIRSIDEEKGIVEAVVSSEAIDRYGEVIKAEAYRKRLKQFMKHPVLVSSHRYSDLRSQIGVWEKVWIEDAQVVGKAKYYINCGNPEADWGFFLAKNGVAAYSVGFMPYEYEDKEYDEDVKKGKKPNRVYTEVELLEISQVLIPANPTALQRGIMDEDPDIKEYATSLKEYIERENIPLEKDVEEDIETKPDTENFYHIANPGEEGAHKDHNIKTVTISAKEGIKAHYCIDCKKITGYLFQNDKWTKEEAEKWVKDHSKSFTPDNTLISDEDEGYLIVSYDQIKEFVPDVEVEIIETHIEEEEEMKEVMVAIEELKSMVTSIEKKIDEMEEDKKKPKGGCKEVDEDTNYIKSILGDINKKLADTSSLSV